MRGAAAASYRAAASVEEPQLHAAFARDGSAARDVPCVIPMCS